LVHPVHRAAVLGLILAACGTDQSSGATFTGTVHGVSMVPREAVSSPATVSFSSGSAPVAAIVISDASALCSKFSANQDAKSSSVLVIFLADVNSSSGAIHAAAGTGEFPVFRIGNGVPPPHFAVASFGAKDAVCRIITADSADAVSGSVTLTANGGGAYSGTYDLTFDSGDHVTGSFHSGTCQGLVGYFARVSHDCG
jgi:hypothetical protein